MSKIIFITKITNGRSRIGNSERRLNIFLNLYSFRFVSGVASIEPVGPWPDLPPGGARSGLVQLSSV